MSIVKSPITREKCLKIKAELAGMDIKLKTFLDEAGFSYAQWWSYQQGYVSPNVEVWERAPKALERLKSEQ